MLGGGPIGPPPLNIGEEEVIRMATNRRNIISWCLASACFGALCPVPRRLDRTGGRGGKRPAGGWPHGAGDGAEGQRGAHHPARGDRRQWELCDRRSPGGHL